MAKPQRKGEALEEAVHAIEAAILARNPAAATSQFTIERRKIVIVGGVKHEIDLFVRLRATDGSEGLVIFECKDQKKSVGKNDILIFGEKVRVTGAQAGYFVAARFGRYARAQAQQTVGIHLLPMTKALDDLPPIVNAHVVSKDSRRIRTEVSYVVKHRCDPTALSWRPVNATINGNRYQDLGDYLRPIVTEMIDSRLARTPTHEMATGEHQLETDERHERIDGTINGIDIIGLKLKVFFSIDIVRPTIVSSFDVATKGRVVRTDSARMPNGDYISFEHVLYNPAG